MITTTIIIMIIIITMMMMMIIIIIIIIINKIQAIGSLAVPVLRYSFGIVNWHQEELQKLDRKTFMDSITQRQT